jgi:hypothetical protein
MDVEKERVMREFAAAILAGMNYQFANVNSYSPAWVAKKAMDYAEAAAEEFIKRTENGR